MFGVSYLMIPKISLLCNILVVTGGSWHYFKSGHLEKKLVAPLVLTSVPFAFIGGSYKISEKYFFILLSLSLFLCGIRILFIKAKNNEELKTPSSLTLCLLGSLLGFLSGIVGIGGGIFLSPIIINLGWARSKNAAAVASFFILLNSVSGFIGQISKGYDFSILSDFFPLFLVVIFGGQIGSKIGTSPKISYHAVQIGTGILTLIVSLRLFFTVKFI